MPEEVTKRSLNILVLAPHPFYEERGTPIACKMLCESLSSFGHKIDLVCFPPGDDVEIPGLTLLRLQNPRFLNLKKIPIGFSFKKLICDALMALRIIKLLAIEGKRYDVIHAGEEAIFLASFLKFLSPVEPLLVYDMDSSMSEQITDKYPYIRSVIGFMEQMESVAVHDCDLILPVCQALADKITVHSKPISYEILEDVYIENSETVAEEENIKCETGELLLLYVGNLEGYQGIDLFIDSLAQLSEYKAETDTPSWKAKLIGGNQVDIEYYRNKAASLNLSDRIEFLGPRPVFQLPYFLQQADILISPRTKGGNTPMKVYSYLASGVPIVATNINSHTQVLDETTAVLTEPETESFAEGLLQLICSPSKRRATGRSARALALSRFSLKAYKKKLFNGYEMLSINDNHRTKSV